MEAWKLKYLQRIESKSVLFGQLGCKLWTGATKLNKKNRQPYGEIHVTLYREPGIRGAGIAKVRPVHRVIFMIRNNVMNLDLDKQIQVSHLCGNSLCTEHSHLHPETDTENKSRQSCHEKRECKGHGGRPDCIV